MIIPITEECNQRCIFCSAFKRNSKELTAQDLRSKVCSLSRTDPLVVISGGEPTLHPELIACIKTLKECGASIELQTNGLRFYSREFTKHIIKLGVNLFNVNVPAHTSALNDTLTKTKHTFSLRKQGVKNLLSFGVRVRITHVIHNLNHKYLYAFSRFVKREFPGTSYIQFSFIKNQGAVADHKNLVPQYAHVQPYLFKALRYCKKNGLAVKIDHIPLCYLQEFMSLHVDFQKFKNKENLVYAKREKKKLAACTHCRLNNMCCGPRHDYIAITKGAVYLRPFK